MWTLMKTLTRGARIQRTVLALLVIFAASVPAWALQSAEEREEKQREIVRALRQDAGEFRLSPGDVIQVKFFYNPELEDTIQIRPDGMISMPFIGELRVEGFTVGELRLRLEELYGPIVKDPGITIQVRQFATQKIYVGGEVLAPRVVTLSGELTVLDAIMEAGGNTRIGSDEKIILIRKDDQGLPVRYQLRLMEDDQQTEVGSIPLRPYDVVLVPETGVARVNRWVDQYIRQMIPIVVTAGFTYLKTAGPVIVP